MYLEVVEVSGVRRNVARNVHHPRPARCLSDQVQETTRDHVGRQHVDCCAQGVDKRGWVGGELVACTG